MSLQPLDIITARAPALAALSGISTYISLATDQTAPATASSWPSANVWAMAVALLAMHWAQLDVPGQRPMGESGPVNSKKEGAAAIGFSAGRGRSSAADPDEDLKQTYWGQNLIGLRDRTFTSVLVAGGDVPAAAWDYGMWESG